MAKNPQPPLSVVAATAITAPRPPRNLGEHGMALWNRVNFEYNITRRA